MANLKKRALSLFMAVMMVLTAMPMNALALEWSDILEDAGSIIEGIDDYAVLVCEKKVVEHTEACKIHTESCYHDHTYSVTVPVLGTVVSYDCKFNNCTAHTHSTENGCPVGNCTAHVHGAGCCTIKEHSHSKSCCTNTGWLHGKYHKYASDQCSCAQKAHTHGTDCNYFTCTEEHEHTAQCATKCGKSTNHTHSDECYSCETPVHKHGENCVCQFGLTRKDIDPAKCALNSHDCNDETHHKHSIEQGCYLLGEVLTDAFYDLTGVQIEQPEEIKAVLAALTGCETGCGLDYKIIATEPYLELSLVLCDEHFCTICHRLNENYCTCVEITFANIGNDPENNKVVKVAKGEMIAADKIPNADMFNYRFLGWFDAEGNEFSTEVVYTEDITFTAQYKALTETEKLENMAQFVKDNFNLGAELGRVISILSKGEITKETIVDKKDEIVNYVTAYLLTSQLTGKMTSEQAAEIVALMDQGDEFVTMLSEWLWTEEDQTIQFDQIISDIDFEKLAEEVKAKITAEYGIEFTQEWVDKNVELLNQYIASVLEEALTEALVEVKDMTEQQMEIVLTQIKNEIEHANFVISLVSAEIVSAVRKEVADVKAFVRELLANRELGIYLGKTVSALSTLNSENVLANGHKLEEVLFKAIRMSALPVAHQEALIAYIDENDGIATQFVDWLWPQISVSWFNGDVFLATEEIASDMKPVFKGETPTKAADAEFTYVFAGWEEIFRDQYEVYYAAVYKNVLNSYTVTWENFDGSVLKTDTLVYGATPAYTGETPTKAADAQYSYNFTGWEQEITKVTGDVTYTAKFAETVNEYTVTFMVDGEKIVHTYAYGAMPEIDAPTKAADAQYTYKFAGWDKEIVEVTGDATYTAKFTNILNYYTIKFVGENGVVLQESNVPYGTKPEYNGETPVKKGSAQYSYNFTGWSPAIVSVTGEATYTAQFNETVNSYTVTWKNFDGSVLKTDTLVYGATPEYTGETPTQAADAQYTYTFAGWSPAIVSVTGDVTYTAQFDKTVNEYTIKFVDEDGTILQESKVPYGTTPEYKGTTPTEEADDQYSYTFAGWSPAIVSVTGEATYTATYSSTVNEYTIKFVDEDGILLYEQTVAYGKTPVYGGETPVKAADAQYTYTFAGWDKEIAEVTGEATYTATYSSTVNEYTIKFVDEDGTELQTLTVAYGEIPVYTGATLFKADTAEFYYDFAGWSPAIVSVTGDATYTAVYTETARTYRVTFKDGDKTLSSVIYAYGDEIVAPALPTKNGWDSKWNCEFSVVTGDLTVEVVWSYKVFEEHELLIYVGTGVSGTDSTKNWTAAGKGVIYGATHYDGYDVDGKYTGSTILTEGVDYESYTATLGDVTINGITYGNETGSNYYVVNEYVVVATDAQYHLDCHATLYHTVTFVDYNGNVIDTIVVERGTAAAAPADPTRKGYVFAGWDKEFDNVTDSMTVTAQYDYEIVESAALKVNVGIGISASGSLKGNGLSHWGTIYNVRSVYSYYDYPNYLGDTIMSENDFDFTRTMDEAMSELGDVTLNNVVYTNGENSSDNYYVLNGEYYFVACRGEFHLDFKADFYSVITFVVDGEETKVVSMLGAQLEMPADPVKDGYEFDGWEIDENGVYHAKFAKIHKVKIVNAPGYNQTLLVRDGETIVLPFDEPTRTGYYCAGWYHYRVQDPKKESFDFSTPVTGDMELSPKWEYSYADRDMTVFAIINGERVELGMGTIENFRHPKTFGYAVVAAKDYKNANFVLPTGEITIDGITYTYGAESGANGYTLTVKNLEVIKVSTGSKYAFECEVEVELYHRVTFNLAIGDSKVFYVRAGEKLDPNWIAEDDFFPYQTLNYWYNGKGGAKLDFDTYVVTQAVSFSCKTKDKYGDWDVALKGTLNGETIELGTAMINGVEHAGCWRNDSANRYNITAYDASQFTMPEMQSIVVDGVTYTYGAGSSDDYYTIDFTTLSCYSIRNSRDKVVDWEYHYTGEIELFHDHVIVNVKIVDGGTRQIEMDGVAHGTVIDTDFVVANVNGYLVVEEKLVILKSDEYTVTAIYTGP